MAINRIAIFLVVARCIIAANPNDTFLRRVLDETKPPAPNSDTISTPSCYPSEQPAPSKPTPSPVESSGKGSKGDDRKIGKGKGKDDKGKGYRRLGNSPKERCDEGFQSEAASSNVGKGGKGKTMPRNSTDDSAEDSADDSADTHVSKSKEKVSGDENPMESGKGKGTKTEDKRGKGKGSSSTGKGSEGKDSKRKGGKGKGGKGKGGKGSIETTAVPSQVPSVSVEPSAAETLQPTVLFSAVPTSSSFPTEADDETSSLNVVFQNNAGEGISNVEIQSASENEGSPNKMSTSSMYGIAITMAVVGVMIGFVVAKFLIRVN